jgi:hypothetical protein
MTEYLDKWDGDIIRALRFQDEEICELAADEIERLRAALQEIAKVTYGWEPGVWSDEEARKYFASLFFGAQAKARAALEGRT